VATSSLTATRKVYRKRDLLTCPNCRGSNPMYAGHKPWVALVPGLPAAEFDTWREAYDYARGVRTVAMNAYEARREGLGLVASAGEDEFWWDGDTTLAQAVGDVQAAQALVKFLEKEQADG